MTVGAENLIREQLDLQIVESADGGLFNPDGTVNMVIIRPCNGRGRGQRIYTPDVLEANAGVFTGWPMFDNHDSPEAAKKRGGMPRSVSELTGVVKESWWDPEFTTNEDEAKGFDQGAVIGRCKLTTLMESFVRDIPEAIKGSVNARATGIRKGSRRGKAGWVVEGFVNDPEGSSFDLVTAAGAGGRVCSLIEGLYDPAYDDAGNTTTGDRVLTIEEALASAEGQAALSEAVESAITGDAIAKLINDKIEEAVAEREETLREELRAELAAPARTRGLADKATAIIESLKLPNAARAKLLEDFGTVGSGEDIAPTPALAVIEAEYAADGTVARSEEQVLEAAINAEADRLREIVREAAPNTPVTSGAPAGAIPTIPAAAASKPEFLELFERRGIDPALFGFKPKTPQGA